jgi:hypothetical protein
MAHEELREELLTLGLVAALRELSSFQIGTLNASLNGYGA